MWRRRRNRFRGAQPAEQPRLVVPESAALTAPMVARLASQIAAADDHDVVIDLSGITELDSSGAAALADLIDGPSHRVQVRGLPEATQRMLAINPASDAAATAPVEPGSAEGGGLVRLRATAVYRPATAGQLTQRLEAILTGLPADIEVAVVDLADIQQLDAAAVDAVAFASSAAALRGLRMLVVNVPAAEAVMLRRAGLSAQTWVSPQPLE